MNIPHSRKLLVFSVGLVVTTGVLLSACMTAPEGNDIPLAFSQPDQARVSDLAQDTPLSTLNNGDHKTTVPGQTTPAPSSVTLPANQQSNQQINQPVKGKMKTLSDFAVIPATQATISTTKGDIVIQLYRDQAPLTTANFLNLAQSGFYNGILFHRVVPDFVIQAGDPLTKDPTQQARWGTGDPGYSIADEFGTGLSYDSEGVVGMANSGPNTGGSQFFITYGPQPSLDSGYPIFGKVTQGMDVVRQIQVGDKIVSVTYQ